MKTEQMTIEITKQERREIERYAKHDFRNPEQFVRWLLHSEFERRRSHTLQPTPNNTATTSDSAS